MDYFILSKNDLLMTTNQPSDCISHPNPSMGLNSHILPSSTTNIHLIHTQPHHTEHTALLSLYLTLHVHIWLQFLQYVETPNTLFASAVELLSFRNLLQFNSKTTIIHTLCHLAHRLIHRAEN